MIKIKFCGIIFSSSFFVVKEIDFKEVVDFVDNKNFVEFNSEHRTLI